MADGLSFSSAAGPATIAHGTIVATDEVSTAGGSTHHYQRVKLARGTLGSTAAISSGAPLEVKAFDSTVTLTALTTASKIQTEITAGQSTAIISTASKILAELSGGQSSVSVTGTVPVTDNGGSLTIDGDSSVSPKAGSTFLVNLSTTGMGGSTAAPLHTFAGGLVAAHSTAPSTFATGATVPPRMNVHGVPWVVGGDPAVQSYEWASSGAATDQILLSSGATTRWAITQVAVDVDEGVTNGVGVRIGFSSGTLAAASTTPVAGIVFSHGGIVPGGGMVRGDGSAILHVGSTDQSLRITADASSGTGQTRVVFSAFAIPE